MEMRMIERFVVKVPLADDPARDRAGLAAGGASDASRRSWSCTAPATTWWPRPRRGRSSTGCAARPLSVVAYARGAKGVSTAFDALPSVRTGHVVAGIGRFLTHVHTEHVRAAAAEASSAVSHPLPGSSMILPVAARWIGLVLGAGGTAGGAYHAGALLALQQDTGWDPRTADVVVGTSIGSIVASSPRGRSDRRPRCVGVGRRTAPRSVADVRAVDRSHQRGPIADDCSPPGRLARRPPPRAAEWSVAAATDPGRAVGHAAPWRHRRATGAGPARRSPRRLASRPALDARRANAGRTAVVFGRDEHPFARPGAIGASCAIPLLLPPGRIGRDHYIDGATHSPTDADLLVDAGVDVAIVIAPMSGRVGRPTPAARPHIRAVFARPLRPRRSSSSPPESRSTCSNRTPPGRGSGRDVSRFPRRSPPRWGAGADGPAGGLRSDGYRRADDGGGMAARAVKVQRPAGRRRQSIPSSAPARSAAAGLLDAPAGGGQPRRRSLFQAADRPAGGGLGRIQGLEQGKRTVDTAHKLVRIPLADLAKENKQKAPDPAKTDEGADARAIVWIHPDLRPTEPVQVLVHLHGLTFRAVDPFPGWRENKADPTTSETAPAKDAPTSRSGSGRRPCAGPSGPGHRSRRRPRPPPG